MPDSVSLASILAVLLPVALVTVALRWAPFIVGKRLPAAHLARTMPLGVLAILAISTVADSTVPAAALGAGTVTLVVQLWRRSLALSIICGTACYCAALALL